LICLGLAFDRVTHLNPLASVCVQVKDTDVSDPVKLRAGGDARAVAGQLDRDAEPVSLRHAVDILTDLIPCRRVIRKIEHAHVARVRQARGVVIRRPDGETRSVAGHRHRNPETVIGGFAVDIVADSGQRARGEVENAHVSRVRACPVVL